MPQIAVKISEPIFAKLKRLARHGLVTYAEVVESALVAYQPENMPVPDDLTETINAALQPLQDELTTLKECLAALELKAHFIAPTAPYSAFGAQGIVVPHDGEIGAEIAAEAAKSAPTNIPSVKEFIADLVANGERSPTVIARAMNDAGYRTGTGSEFQRSNPQIAGALKRRDAERSDERIRCKR